jgi:hypothetical protein
MKKRSGENDHICKRSNGKIKTDFGRSCNMVKKIIYRAIIEGKQIYDRRNV